jgi:hypothetical protein
MEICGAFFVPINVKLLKAKQAFARYGEMSIIN